MVLGVGTGATAGTVGLLFEETEAVEITVERDAERLSRTVEVVEFVP